MIVKLLRLLRNKWRKWRALNGAYGEEAQWATELVANGDEEFAYAVESLSKQEIQIIGAVAENKEELRKITIQKAEETELENIPKEFAQ